MTCRLGGPANWQNRLDFMYSLRYSPLSKISSSNNKNLELILINSGIPLRTSFTKEALEKLMNAIEAQKIRRQGNWKNRLDFLYSLRYSPLSKISSADFMILIKSGMPLRKNVNPIDTNETATIENTIQTSLDFEETAPIDIIETGDGVLEINEETTIENAIQTSPDFEETAPIDIIEAGDGVLEINGKTDPINSTIHADDILDLDDEDEHHNRAMQF